MVEDSGIPCGLLFGIEQGYCRDTKVGYQPNRYQIDVNSCMSSVLEKAGFVKSPAGGFDVSQFVNTEVAKLA